MGLAALSSQQEILTTLLESQRDTIDEKKEKKLAIALLTATQGRFCNIVLLLLSAGADPNFPVNKEMAWRP